MKQGWVGFVVVQALSCVRFIVTPTTAIRQTSLSFTASLNLLKLMSIESVMPSNRLILCHPFFCLPSIINAAPQVFCLRLIKGVEKALNIYSSWISSFSPRKQALFWKLHQIDFCWPEVYLMLVYLISNWPEHATLPTRNPGKLSWIFFLLKLGTLLIQTKSGHS